MKDTLLWLLEDSNPAIQYRTRTELLGENSDISPVRDWILSRLPADWPEAKGLWYRYYILALAECGLKHENVPQGCLDRAIGDLETAFECGCADFMLLYALVKLGLGECKAIHQIIASLNDRQLPDGGFVCERRLKKLGYTPKSCYKANLHALMLAAGCKKAAIEAPFTAALAEYFLRRNIFYRSDTPDTLVLDSREGWRCTDIFHPFETMRVGLHSIVEAFAALGFGQAEPVRAAFNLLEQHKNVDGRVILDATLTKSYLPKERVGKPAKWPTFYALLAEKER